MFRGHEKSEGHQEAIAKLAALSNSVNVGAQLLTRCEEEQAFHREMLLKVLSSIQFLARQGLALRGHSEGVDALQGNLLQLLLLRAQDCPRLDEWLRKKEYVSPQIVNELINLMGQAMLRQLVEEIREAKFYSLIADEATDISRQEQMCVSIRWIDSSFIVHEDALGLVQLPNTKAATVFSQIKDILVRCMLPVAQCRGQAFDGASNMSGIRNGVQALLKREEPRALYVHCLAHSLNLAVQDMTAKCDLVRNVMTFVLDLVQLIKFSPKRTSLFDSLRKDVAINSNDSELTPSLRSLCPTRWTVRHSSIDSILQNYSILISALEEIEQGHDQYAAKASGLLSRMLSFDTLFSLKLAYLVFSAAEQLSINLQAKNTCVQEATRGASLLVSHFRHLRQPEEFEKFYENVISASSGVTDSPVLPRYRKLPKHVDNASSPHRYQSPKDRFRHAYFEALELAVGEVERRFEQSDMKLIKEMEVMLVEAANGVVTDSIHEDVTRYLAADVDCSRLKVQLGMVSDMVKTAFSDATTPNKTTNVRTICDAMNESEIYKGMLGEVEKVLRIYLNFPVTTATAERSFSSLRRIKTFLRSSMTNYRLNNLFMLYVHSDRAKELDIKLIAKEFVSVTTRRLNYFGNYGF